MVLQTEQKTEQAAVVLPRVLHLGTAFGLRFPFLTALLILLEFAAAVFLVNSLSLLPIEVTVAFLALCCTALALILHSGWSMWSTGLLPDLVDLVGESESKPYFAWANVEVWASIAPALVTGLLPLAGYFVELHPRMGKLPEWERAVIPVLLAYCTFAGFFLCLSFVGGHLVLVHLVAELLKSCVRGFFDHLEATMTNDGLSKEEKLERLDARCKRMKRAFDKANRCVTPQISATVVAALLVSLVMVLQLVVVVRSDDQNVFLLVLLGGMSVVASGIGMVLLYSMTSVADCYEDVASDLSHNKDLAFKLTNTFPGPAGVKLLSNFENGFVNDFSFHWHHRPLDARVMEATTLRVFVGAVVTVVIGALT